jgi:inositol-polyphosphate multikinase
MPTFLGSLRPAADQPGLSKLLHESGGVGAAPDGAVGNDNGDGEKAAQEEKHEDDKGGDKEGWKPSGGKKLSTGLAICLENTASGCVRPCVLDLKLGARLWDNDAPEAKRQKLDEVARETTSGSLGFRVAGMKVWVGGGEWQEESRKLGRDEEEFVKVEKEGEGAYKVYDKWYGRQFKGKEDVRKAFEAYLPAKGGKAREEVGSRFVRELESVVYMLENTESRMYSASLLFVYEGDEEALGKALEFEKRREATGEDGEVEVEEGEGRGQDENDEEIEPKVHDLRMIDFAHARWTKGEGPDENALRGVRSALEILREVLKE